MGQTFEKRAPYQAASEEEKRIRDIVKCPTQLDKIIGQCLLGRGPLKRENVTRFLRLFRVGLRLPGEEVNPAHADMLFARFDADSNGSLSRGECFRMAEAILNKELNKLSGDDELAIPKKKLKDHYNIEKKLGQGGQGVMYLATDKGGNLRCVKSIDKANPNAPLESIKSEFQFMKSFNSPYVARTYEIFTDCSRVYIVSEPYGGGDLRELATNARKAGVVMNESWFCGIFKQVLKGLVYLHQFGLIHCDIKEGNIMIADDTHWANPHAILIDFGLGTKFISDEQGVCGTPGYIPPEVYKTGYWVDKGDIFSAGVTFYGVLAGESNPVMTTHVCRQNRSAFLCDVERRTRHVENFLSRLSTPNANSPLTGPLNASTLLALRKMLSKDLSKRPSAAECLQEKCFSDKCSIDLLSFKTLCMLEEVQHLRWSPAQQAAAELAISKVNLSEKFRSLIDLFRRLDVNGDGLISIEEARRGLYRIPDLEDAAIERIIKSLSGTGNSVDYIRFVSRMTGKLLLEKSLSCVFRSVDANGDRYISKEELPALLKECRYDEALRSSLMDELDANGDGRISLDEFKKALMKENVDPKPEDKCWTCDFCGEYNKKSRVACNNCNGKRPQVVDARGVKRAFSGDEAAKRRMFV